MPELIINGIPVNFPFEPYDLQKAYMTKVIDCLQSGTNGVLESPTGTGKTLCLLCSSLGWLITKKAQMQASHQAQLKLDDELYKNTKDPVALLAQMNEAAGGSQPTNWGIPKIIYASRTHSQLTQAMQELKQSSYSFLKAAVLGSRDQLCIHPEVMRETNNSNKIQMCKLRITTKSCSFHSRVESKKDHPDFKELSVMDIEDLVKVGQKLKMCPYYGSKELIQDADITFMPYNYLLDPKARKANKVELKNTVVILDEAHNVEKLCEESASVQIKSSDIAMAIDDITHIMKALEENPIGDSGDEAKDFSMEDLALLKEMLLELEKAVDDIVVENKAEGETFPAGFMFELLAKANITSSTKGMIIGLTDKLIQFLAMASQNTMLRKGMSLMILSDLITVVFSSKEDNMSKVFRCFKVHIEIEEIKQTKSSSKKDNWITTHGPTNSKFAKVINYWCFNPGFGMDELLNKNVRSIILTSGTLAPLKPLIAELGIPIAHRLENPHIVGKHQVCVKIVPFGPDKEPLISNYQNRDNPKYINSLGRTILTFCPVVPDGLLVFFPSYPLMNKCTESWQASGIWSQISRHKPIFVEPRSKEAFNSTMKEFYAKINDPSSKGACFMAVCRGKVSEGLDFADINGRAVIITGLPFPPLKDPRVILKKRYLDDNRTKENELLSGQSWYALEATRAVNQAIGRVIRHRHDYGAILLCDSRFSNPSQKSQLSSWVQGHMQSSQQNTGFGPIIGELSRFFRNAEKTVIKPNKRKVEEISEKSEKSESCSSSFADPLQVLQAKRKFQEANQSAIKVEKANSISQWKPEDYSFAAGKTKMSAAPNAFDFMSRLDGNISTIDFNKTAESNNSGSGLVAIHKRERTSPSPSKEAIQDQIVKRKKFKLISNSPQSFTSSMSSTSSQSTGSSQGKEVPLDRVELLKIIKNSLSTEKYADFVKALTSYRNTDNFDQLFSTFRDVFGAPCLHYLLKGMRRFVKENHKSKFDERIRSVLPS